MIFNRSVSLVIFSCLCIAFVVLALSITSPHLVQAETGGDFPPIKDTIGHIQSQPDSVLSINPEPVPESTQELSFLDLVEIAIFYMM